jgi:hypothetical protein
MSKTSSYRAGTDTGSLVNLLYSGSKDQVPTIGMGATILCWTDRHAATIVEVSAKRVGIRQDEAIRTDTNGMSDSQQYEYKPGNGPVTYYTLRKNGAWVREGEPMKGGQRITIGVRDEHYDFSF